MALEIDLSGRVAFVTGGSRGLGRADALTLARAGADVAIADILVESELSEETDRWGPLATAARTQGLVHTEETVEDIRALGCRALAVRCDVTDREQVGAAVSRTVEELGAVDILINNAGFGTYGLFAATSADEEARLIQVNVMALTMLTKLLLPPMLQRRHGRIMNVASTAAFQPGPLMAVYYASKAYVLSFSEALSNETAGTGVTVTCLCPGPTRTGFQERAQMQESRLLSTLAVASAADVARAGFDGMMAGQAIVVPGTVNKIGVQALRVTPRAIVRRLIRSINDQR